MSMITSSRAAGPSAPASVVALLRDLRRRIRWYVVLEGAAMLIVWCVAAFWFGLAIDYLPVLVGANETPVAARRILLLLVALGASAVLYYYVLRRVFRTLHDTSLALLVERQFPSFADSLVTSVEPRNASWAAMEDGDREAVMHAVGPRDPDLESTMLEMTIDRAQADVAEVRLGKVFTYGPLAKKVVAAVSAGVSLILLGVWGGDTLGVGVSRLLLLSEEPWPRYTRIELVDFDEAGQRKVAKGTDLVIRVRADANRRVPPPTLCTILYETSDGDRGRVNMSRDGEPRDGYQYYVFNGKPFNSILNDIRFDVIGYDHRLQDQLVKVVLSPVVKSVRLRSELPSYTTLLPREEEWHPGLELPIGSQISGQINSSKELLSATVLDIDSGEEQVFDFRSQPQSHVFYDIESLSGRVAVAISLLDTDGIPSLEPFVLTIGAVEDTTPQVDVALRGIGNAITPSARLAVEGRITDDYEVAKSWYDLKIGEEQRKFDFPHNDAQYQTALDLREQSAASNDQPLTLKPQDRIVFSVKATDHFDLGDETHVGSSDPTILSVVRPDELLAILDGRELGLRRRFEQIRTEMLQSRDSLARLAASFAEADNTPNSDSAAQNLSQLRDRWASWADQKADQTVLEVDGIALAFEDIREELINNRVDTPERKVRMEQEIIAPLRTIADDLFPAFEQSLAALRTALRDEDVSAQAKSVDVLEAADNIIVAIDAVLEKMLQLEDYTELVNIVRQILEQQNNLLEKTKEEQKSRVLDLLK